MAKENKDFCFCTLALGKRYRIMARQLAKDIEKYYPETKFVVLTEKPEEFREKINVLAFKHKQKFLLHCYNDKVFLIKKALELFDSVIHIDADTKITKSLKKINILGGITGNFENLISHVKKNTPERINILEKLAQKITINLEKTKWIGESLFSVTKFEEKEKEFLDWWEKIAWYLELNGIAAGIGLDMGLAAEKIGFPINNYKAWDNFRKTVRHMDASDHIKPTKWEFWKKRISYHYRLNKARLLALKDFNFYYR